jgi:hypothetical protein
MFRFYLYFVLKVARRRLYRGTVRQANIQSVQQHRWYSCLKTMAKFVHLSIITYIIICTVFLC